ncbi:hypothetical protein C2E25_14960 [Geothermobacter hydrogeniphilus]|uniref:Uncharacterized protein n=1 Tax=Geothermobacter hydrogeniphilus TaxID=1969733 RepID=A0A2K2H6V4_9BACT|nr:hypothetical protein [Geothermobacter hydrogeniphilus]PNU18981.1 hypothetical protein C2E25_14960 [Geothermobacter hydrogeniphilus]
MYCAYYWLLEPLRGGIKDSNERTPAFKFDIKPERLPDTYEFALYADQDGVPEFARLIIPNLDEKVIPDEVLPLLQTTKEHLITVLRLTYSYKADYFPLTAWTFFSDDQPLKFGLETRLSGKDVFNPDNTKNLFFHSMSFREDLRLFVDGGDERIPLQYRFLSYYKILEKNFKKNGLWKKEELEQHLKTYEELFKEAGFIGKPSSTLHSVRDKCAHIRTGNTRESLGVTHLNHKEAVITSALLPILNRITGQIINSTFADRKIC